MRPLVTLLLLCLLAIPTAAQQMVLTTTYASNNGDDGNMFDIVALNTVVIDMFNVNLDTGLVADYEVYFAPQSHVGIEQTPSAWTFIGSATGVVSNGTDVPTPLPININVCIPSGGTIAFYVTRSNGCCVNYTNGTAVGNVAAQDANIQVLEGTGNGYPFTSIFMPRIFNGDIFYTPVSSCPALPFETNSPEASLDIGGVQSNGYAPAVTGVATGIPFSLGLQSTLTGNLYDVGVVVAALMPSVLVAPNGEVVNINVFDPSLLFLNSGSPMMSLLPFPGNFALTVPAPPVALTASAQMVVADATAPGGFYLSQGVQLDTQACSVNDNFDGLSAGGSALPFLWTNGVGGTVPWTVNTGGTTSSATGPTSANSLPNYLYAETSSPNIGATFTFDTCPVDASQLSGTLNFALSRIGATIGTLNVYLDDGSGTFGTLLTTYTGPDPTQAQGATEWSNESLPFTVPGSGLAAFRFEYTGGTSFTADLAIDDLSVQ